MILRLLKVRYLWANFILKMILIIWCFPCPVHGDDLTPRCSAWRTLGVVSSAAGSPRTLPGPRGRGWSSVSQTYNRSVSLSSSLLIWVEAWRELVPRYHRQYVSAKKACDFAYDRLLQLQNSMMLMSIALYWVTFFIDSLNVECWLWVRQRRRLPGLERGNCQTHKVGKVSKICTMMSFMPFLCEPVSAIPWPTSVTTEWSTLASVCRSASFSGILIQVHLTSKMVFSQSFNNDLSWTSGSQAASPPTPPQL